MEYRHPLLRRLYAPTIAPNADHLTGTKIVVTGAGGSIGSVLCRHILRADPAELICLDSYDGNLWRLGQDLNDNRIKLALGSVTNQGRMFQLFDSRPSFVFHCAASKHVPLVEDPLNTMMARRVNVGGMMNVLNAAGRVGAVVVNCSTDKAAAPASAMGRQKREAERLLTGWVERGNHGASVRFGNVLDSVGSVLPIWRNQIALNRPIRITDVRMARYFLTADTAAGLLIRAAAEVQSRPGLTTRTLMVPDLGEPIMMLAIAHAMANEAGTTIEDIGLEETGMRPGEKMTECMLADGEKARRIEVKRAPAFARPRLVEA